jgi:hypothetical protein
MGGVINKPASKITKNLSEVERQLGIDLKLTPDGDLELSNLNDFKLISGGANAAQAVVLKLFTEPGGLVYHPEIGTDLRIGEKTVSVLDIQTQIIKSLSQDPRFNNVRANVSIDGQTIFVDIKLVLTNTGDEVPLKFAVQR